MAHTHVRLNATQIHNAIRREIGMETAPDDPSRRRSYVAAVNALLDAVEPASINFGSLLNEGASATRLMMVVAQMLKYVDATTPVRFLIAECETAFTLLVALYFAKLFGVAGRVEISPLFETRKALERAPGVVGELLSNPHYRAYVETTGRLCIQTGYSDAGRYLGQTVAGASIERMRMRIGEVFARHGLRGVELVIFDTHGESIGRGAHPAGFGDRLRYVSPPESRRRFARAGTAFKQETSFQGGDGYVWFFTPAAAFATVTRILEFALAPPDEDLDPFYEKADYIAEFFTSIQFFNDAVLRDPNYAALLGAFGTNMLYPIGSRSLRRQHEPGVTADLTSPAQLRAIPHNATLQQLGYLANTLGGAGQAIRKDPVAFREMYTSSPRFRRVFGLIAWALAFSDADVLKAYVDTLDPGLWLLRTAQPRIDRERFDELRAIGGFIEGHAHHDRLNAILRTLERDLFDMQHALAGLAGDGPVADVPAAMTDDLRLLHVIRITLIQRIFMLATHVPEFSPRHELSPEEVRTCILRLDVGEALEALHTIFPAARRPRAPPSRGLRRARDLRDRHRPVLRPGARAGLRADGQAPRAGAPDRLGGQPHHRRGGLIARSEEAGQASVASGRREARAGAVSSPRRQVRPHHLVGRGRGRIGVLAPLPEVEADADPFEGATVLRRERFPPRHGLPAGRWRFRVLGIAGRPRRGRVPACTRSIARILSRTRLGAGARHVRLRGMDEPSGERDEPAGHGLVVDLAPGVGGAAFRVEVRGDHVRLRARIGEAEQAAVVRGADVVHAAPQRVRVGVVAVERAARVDVRPHRVAGRLVGVVVALVREHAVDQLEDLMGEGGELRPQVHVGRAVPAPELRHVRSERPPGVTLPPRADVLGEARVELVGLREVGVVDRRREEVVPGHALLARGCGLDATLPCWLLP